MLNITKGKQLRPLKVVIYASEGVGKTTLASKFPDPLFVDTEDGTFNLDVSRVDKPQSWNQLIEIVQEVAKSDICKTLVIDTLDWVEMLAIADVCNRNRVASIESIAYGKGYVFVGDCFVALLKELDKVIESGKHVVLTAHAKTRKFELPEESGQYDKWEMKLSRQVAPLIKEWSDMLLFGNYKTYVVANENGTKKAQGGKRVMYSTHHPCWDGKNRFDLPEEMDLDFNCIAHLFADNRDKTPIVTCHSVKSESDMQIKLKNLLENEKLEVDDFIKVVASRGYYQEAKSIDEYSDEFIMRWIIPNIKKIAQATKEMKGEINND